MKNYLLLLFYAVYCLLPTTAQAQPKISLVDYVGGFVRPVGIEHCHDSRLFVVEQRGYIWIVDSMGNKLPNPFLNIDAQVRSTGNEQGLLGLAFPPNYDSSGYFYVYYTREPDGDTRVSRFRRDSMDTNLADPLSEEILLAQDQPYTNHNAGAIKFGPDGYLYIGLGDGGSGGDPQGNGQNKLTFLGKILRIDVSTNSTGYTIPADNPFVNNPAFLPEIWSWGWRNPWRFSFDRLTGDLWVGDVGQNAWEEIDFEPANTGGLDYGWRCYEGNHPYNTSGCPPAGTFAAPAFDYPNPAQGCSVTGGYLYRGSKYSDLYGLYLFTDYCSGRWWVTRHNSDGSFFTEQIADLSNNQYSSLGEGPDGELYVALLASGKIQRITEICSAFQLSGTVTDAYCNGAFSGIIDLDVTGATGNVDFIWSNGQSDSLNVYLNPGTYYVLAADANGCERRDTFVVGSEVVLETPVFSAYQPGDTATFCTGSNITLAVNALPAGITEVRWYKDGQLLPNASGTSLTVTVPAAYTVAFADIVCESNAAGPVYVVEQNIAAPTIGLTAGQAVLCPGDSATLMATSSLPAGYNLQWFRNGMELIGENATSLVVTTAGSYSVSVQGTCGSFASAAFDIDQEMLAAPVISSSGDTLIVAAGWPDYQWFLDGQPINNGNDNMLLAEISGYYECQVTSANGCAYTAGIQFMVSNSYLPESVERCDITPNPTTSTCLFKMELKQKANIQLSMSDSRHRELFRQTLSGRSFEKEIELQALPAGTYFLLVQIGNEQFVRKLVKM
ncbi:MAG: PQQ-dependent sugar dehydrogenase [Lewinellaceae bacterium]|nr:PQQ-dependent sugar dehydrogenase [Lewinellaceae bacterium]